jgi:hypothetical protein
MHEAMKRDADTPRLGRGGGERDDEDVLPLQQERRQQRALVGTLGLFALFFGTYLTLLSQANHQRLAAAGYQWLPLVFALTFMTASQLFRALLRCRLPSGSLLMTALPTLLLGTGLCVLLRAPLTAATMSDFINSPLQLFADNRTLGVLGRIGLMVTIEESIKLTPIIVLVLAGLFPTPRVAMLCAALSGMSFGMIEAINYSVFIYPAGGSPISSYLVRTRVMAPSHGVGTAIACGFIYFAAIVRGGRGATPSAFDAMLGFMAAMVLHAAHNALQHATGPFAQVVTIFMQLAVLHALVRAVEKEGAAADTDAGTPLAAEAL